MPKGLKILKQEIFCLLENKLINQKQKKNPKACPAQRIEYGV